MIFFSVIIPSYNRAKSISKAIDSILIQKIEDIEIIVVDDGSTDNTIDVLKKYDNKIKILQQENRGPGAARNLGIKSANGKYIAFLDSDDLWFSWTLTKYREIIIQQDYPTFIAGKTITFTTEKELDLVPNFELIYQSFSDYYSSSKSSLWLLPGAVVIQADSLQHVAGFTDKWINGEDSDLWLKLGTAKHFVSIESPPMLAYRQHSNSAVANNYKTYQGAWHMIEQEKSNSYPGGKSRKLERIEILMRHIRPVSLAYLKENNIADAWEIYSATFKWNLALKRFVYLGVFLLIWLKTYFESKINLFFLKTLTK